MTSGAHWIFGDMNFDGAVTGDDFAIVVANLGKGIAAPLSEPVHADDEPSATSAADGPRGRAFALPARVVLPEWRRVPLQKDSDRDATEPIGE